MRSAFKKNQSGFTLIELMIVVAIVGILAVLAIYGVRRYMANAKTAEARGNIGEISKDAIASFDRETMPPGVMALGGNAVTSRNVCGNAIAVPATVPQGAKFQSTPAMWAQGAAVAGGVATGWACLRFSVDSPQYYQYNYQGVLTQGGQADAYTATATGDLNGDGQNFSVFTLQWQATGGVMRAAPVITEVNPDE